MLVLTMKKDAPVFITASNGEVIRVFLLRNDRGNVRVGFDAKRSVSIDREEIYARKKAGLPPRVA